jgi:Tol biopolymer transport system component
MRPRFVFLVATLLVVGCRDGAVSSNRTLAADSGGTSAQRQEAVTRRVWSGRDVDSLGSPSPDGKLLSHVDWSTGNLAVREFATGQSRAIVTARGDVTDFAYVSVISPDGKRIAYSFFDGDIYDLRVVDIAGGTPRTVFRKTESLDVVPMAWSPDGSQILAVIRWKDATSQMAFIAVASGATRVLKTLGWRYPSKLALSPDGRYIAYDFTRDEASDTRDISILAVDGATDAPAVVHKSDDRVRGWSPDGRMFFSSDRDGTPTLWALNVKDGRVAGEPVRVKSDLWRLDHALGFDRSGAFYYSVNPTVADLYTATIDPVSMKITAAPQPLSGAAGVTRGPGAWSPDGRLLAYLVSDQAVSVSFSGVAIRSLETGDERTLNPQLTQVYGVQWFPDNRALLLGGTDFKGRQGYYRLDAQSGAVTVIRHRSPDEPNIGGGALSADGKTLYIRMSADAKGQTSVLMARDVASGQEREIHRSAGAMSGVSPSRDGLQLAMAVRDAVTGKTSIVILPATGGTPRTVLALPEGQTISPNAGLMQWGTSNHLLVTIRTNAERQTEIWRVALDGSGAQKLEISLSRLTQPQARLHPDGRRLLFRTGEVTKEIWALQPASSR